MSQPDRPSTADPIRKSQLPSIPPPEFEFKTVLTDPSGHLRLSSDPGYGNFPEVRRLLSYGDWEPVQPDRWAEEPPPAFGGTLASEADPKAASKPFTQGYLRDRIARALAGTKLRPPFQHCLAAADAVLAVLLARTDRAAVLREAADDLEAWEPTPSERWSEAEQARYEDGIDAAADRLRRLADEAQQTPTVDLPARLEAALTERFTALGNPFSRMRYAEKGPDGWPAEHPIGPHHVAEVLRELLADEGQQAAPVEQDALRRVRAVLETEAVVGRSALEYRGLITSALMAGEAQQPEGVSPAYARLQVAAKAAAEAAHLHAMRGMRAVYQLCRQHGFGDQPIPAAEVLAALGLDENANTVAAEGAQQSEAVAADVQPEAGSLPEGGWVGATELAPDRVIGSLAASGLVGYGQDQGRLLHCLAHKPAPASRYADFHEVTADDLDDGGVCVHPRCGRDLLAPWPVEGEQR